MKQNKKKYNDFSGMVYSTDPDFVFEPEANEEATLPPNQQKLNIRHENKGRGGKTVTLVSNFKGTYSDLEKLSKELKSHCGTGGSVVEWEILIQGDQRKKVMEYLQKKGFKTNNPL